jgi:hypothetical protein
MGEKGTRSGEQTDLNVYLCDNHGFEVGQLDQWIARLVEDDHVTGHAESYVSDHTFSETVGDDDISLVTITTPARNREDEFLLVTTDGSLWVFTTVRREWRQKTIENLLDYLPCVERLYLTADDLETLTREVRDSRISGFTAKYHAPNRERDATLIFSGAEEGDLETAEEAFDAKPTRIEFDQTNSPDTAIQGANNNDGRLTLRSVRRGSQQKAVETLLGISDEYERLNRRRFEVEHRPVRHELDSGFRVEGFTAIELTDPDRETVDCENLRDEIETAVLNANRYQFGVRDGGRKLRVFDSEHDEMFDVALEPPDIVLYARESTTALSLRSFVRTVYDDFDSTYTLQKVTNSIGKA